MYYKIINIISMEPLSLNIIKSLLLLNNKQYY